MPAVRGARPQAALAGPPPRGAPHTPIVEREHLAADDLAGFMAFAGDHQHVAGAQVGDRGADRLAPVADLGRVGRSRPGSRRRIAAGFSLRGLSSVTITGRRARRRSGPSAGACRGRGRRRRRRRTTSRCRGVRAQRPSTVVERVGRMGVIDKHRCAAALLPTSSQAARDARQSASAATAGSRSPPVASTSPRAASSVHRLEGADQGQFDVVALAERPVARCCPNGAGQPVQDAELRIRRVP